MIWLRIELIIHVHILVTITILSKVLVLVSILIRIVLLLEILLHAHHRIRVRTNIVIFNWKLDCWYLIWAHPVIKLLLLSIRLLIITHIFLIIIHILKLVRRIGILTRPNTTTTSWTYRVYQLINLSTILVRIQGAILLHQHILMI